MKDIALLPRFIAQMFDGRFAAFKWGGAVIAGLIAFIFPLQAQKDAAMGAFVMLIVDTVTGIVAAWQLKQPLTSAKFGRVLVKMLGYGSVLLVVAWITKLVPVDFTGKALGMTSTLWFVFATEALSVLENVHKANLPVPWFIKPTLERMLGPREPKEKSNEKNNQVKAQG